jgi:thiol:disulfide interchange protein DsbD
MIPLLPLLQTLVPAFAGGTVSPPPPPPPKVDFSALPDAADQQPTQPDGKDHPVRARLLVDRTAVAPGETVRIGLHLTQMPEWHTYWKSPGDIGLPTGITWRLPDGATAEPYQYPVPQRFDVEGLVSYGYDDQVLLFSEVSIPAGTRAGEAPIGASAEWLVCKSSCIPGAVELASTLTIGPGGEPTPYAPLFDHYAAQHPQTAIDGVDAQLVLSHDAVTPFAPFKAAIQLSSDGREVALDASRYPFAPITGDGWMINTTEVGTTKDGGIVARLDAETLLDEPPASDRVGGLFLLEVDGKPTALELVAPLPWKKDGATAVEHPALTVPISAVAPDSAEGDGHDEKDATDDEDAGLASFDDPEVVQLAGLDASAASSGGLVGVLTNLGMAFLGGLLLNIMPCVLPVLTLKLYSLVEQSDISASEQRTAGLAYTAGILASFWVLAGAILTLKLAFGQSVAWGFQFQYPPYVAGLAVVVFAFSLSLFGVFEIPAMGVSTASAAGAKEGPAGYFFTGVFATLLATPCSAPFLGTAIGFALGSSPPMLFGIFTMVGAGLAAPFLLIAFVPAAYALLPRPGAWMETFKQLLGFSLVATAVWLVSVLGAQIGLDRVVQFLVVLMFVAAGCWVFGHFGGVAASGRRQLGAAVAGLIVAVVGAWGLPGGPTVAGFELSGYLDLRFAEPAVVDDGTVETDLDFSEDIPWQPFSEDRLAQLRGQPVFVDFTAEWCLTCKVNEKTVLDSPSVRTAMAENGVVPLKADWTRRDETITAWLARYGKAGVPFYLVIPAEGDPIPLGEVITRGMVIDALERAKG